MIRLPAAWLLAASLLSGCASAPWDYDGQGRPVPPPAVEKEHAGVVESVRAVEVESMPTGVGGLVGSVAGGMAGASVGRGRGAAVGSVIGTVAGAVAGEAAAQAATQPGVEITVRLDEGRVIAVTQPVGETFQPGDRVRVITDGVRARVTKVAAAEK